jgi:hypothetical protein
MITIFCDFCHFSAKKMAFFSKKNNVMINFFQNLALFRVKNANFFAKFFGENILKIIKSAPGTACRRRTTRPCRGPQSWPKSWRRSGWARSAEDPRERFGDGGVLESEIQLMVYLQNQKIVS